MLLTTETNTYTRAQSRDAISNHAKRTLQDDVVDILLAAHRHGVDALTVSEIADQYQKNTGKFKPPSSFSSAKDALHSANRICKVDIRLYAGTGRMQDAWRLVAQQSRLVA